MPERDSGERYVYCRHGDIIDELKRIGVAPAKVPAGGGDHYLAAFLQWSGASPVLLMASRPENAEYSIAHVQAKTFRYSRGGGKTIRSYIEEITLFFSVLSSLVSFRPTKILCAKIGPALWACFLYARMRNIPLVHSRHTRVEVLSTNPIRKLWFYLDRWILRRVSRVICHGPYLEKQLLNIGVPESRILQYNLDYRYLLTEEQTQQRVSETVDDSRDFVILFVGRIHRNKGVFDLLAAALPLLESNPDVRLVYAGQGPDLVLLEQRIRESGSSRQIESVGFVRHELLPALVRQSHIVVAPTRPALTEGLCRVVPESFVLGRPVVAPEFGPFPFLIDDGVNGLLFQPESVSDLRLKISQLVENPEFWKKLKSGATASGKRHLAPELDFPRALRKALGD